MIKIQPGPIYFGLACFPLRIISSFSWPSITLLIKIYTQLEGYSHGLMVPIVWGYATYQLWTKTKHTKLKPSWTGLPVVALGIIVTIFAYWYYISSFKSLRGVALILCMGLLLCVLGFYLNMVGGRHYGYFAFLLSIYSLWSPYLRELPPL